jgi:hypothetical protein
MRTTVKILTALVLAAATAAAATTAAATTAAAFPATGGTAAPAGTAVYVWNLHGDEQGRPDVRPGDLVLSEDSTLNGISWRSWGGARAAGRGRLSGTWCLPGCLKKPYKAAVTLSRVRQVGDHWYYTSYAVNVPGGDREATPIRGNLPTP